MRIHMLIQICGQHDLTALGTRAVLHRATPSLTPSLPLPSPSGAGFVFAYRQHAVLLLRLRLPDPVVAVGFEQLLLFDDVWQKAHHLGEDLG